MLIGGSLRSKVLLLGPGWFIEATYSDRAESEAAFGCSTRLFNAVLCPPMENNTTVIIELTGLYYNTDKRYSFKI